MILNVCVRKTWKENLLLESAKLTGSKPVVIGINEHCVAATEL